MSNEEIKNAWIKRTMTCKNSRAKTHEWMPIARSLSKASENVTEIMCTACYEILTLAEIRAHRASQRLEEPLTSEEMPDIYEVKSLF